MQRREFDSPSTRGRRLTILADPELPGLSELRHAGRIPGQFRSQHIRDGIGVPGELLFPADRDRENQRFFGRSAQRLTSDSRPAAGLELLRRAAVSGSL